MLEYIEFTWAPMYLSIYVYTIDTSVQSSAISMQIEKHF